LAIHINKMITIKP